MSKRQSMSFTARSAVRRSYQLGSAGGVFVAAGVWVVIGLYGLAGSAVALSGAQAAWAFLLIGLLFLPTALSWAELMSWVRGAGGSYRLARAAERPALTLLVGLAHLLGWVALSALVADAFAAYAAGLLELVLPPLPDRRLLALPPLLFFTLANLTGHRSRRKVQALLLGGSIVVVLLLTALMVPGAWRGAAPALAGGSGSRLFASVALLAAAMWATDVTFEMQSAHRRPLQVLLVGTLAGPGVGLLLMLVARRAVPLETLDLSRPLLAALAREATAFGAASVPATLGAGLLVSAVTWQVVTLASLRQVADMGYDGWLPGWLRRSHPRYGTPARVVLLQSLVVLLLVALGPMVWLGRLSALALLMVGIGVNAAAFLSRDHPQAENRPFRLPFGGLLPAVGVGTNLLLLPALGPGALLVGALWVGVGFAAFWRHGQEQRMEAQRGVTVFQERGEDEERLAYNVLVAVGNPERDANLLAFGEAIARQRGGRVVALNVVRVPDQLRLDAGRLKAQKQLDTLERVTDKMEERGVPIYAVTRLSRSVAQGILDTMAEEDPDLIVMGWHARPRVGGGLGHILDRVVSNATCDVAVVRGDWPRQPGSILVPTRGGPNAPLAAELAQALTADSSGQVTLLNVVRSPASQQDMDSAAALLESQIETLPSDERTVPQVVTADEPVRGILEAADGHDAVMLGASEESFLDQALFGQVPELIARQTDSAVAMVRRYRGLPAFWLRKVWESASQALPALEREDQLAVYARLRRSARPNINYFVLITLSAIIATLGLLLNSPAVIIGAMLVAPLMTPIVATAIGISFGDVRTLRLSIESTLQGVLLAVFIAIVVALVSPLREVNSEILARTQPTLLDLFVALASGMAGAYAIARKEVGEALPGVAIAAALMPPVCTIGVGVALADLRVAGGALLLFVTNLIAITLAAAVVFLLLGIRPPQERARRLTLRRGLATSAVSLLVVSLPLAFILFRTTGRDQLNRRVTQTVEAEVAGWDNAEVESLTVEEGRDEVTVTATLRASRQVNQEDVERLDAHLEEALDRPVRVQLFVVPVSELESGPP